MILRELFDKPAKWIEVDNDMGFAYQFQTKDGKGYEVTLDVDDDFVYEVIFADEAGRINLTGAGNAGEVIGTVIAILKAHVKEHNMPDLSFSAEANEPSRVKLYTRLVNKLSGDMGYEVEAINHMGMKSWKLTKKQNATESTQVNELLDKPLEWWADKEQYDSARYGLTTSDGRNFTVEFDQEPNDEWEFIFRDSDLRMDLTGSGGAVEIFATVKDIALHFFKKYKPKTPVYFQADNEEPSRVKLYKRAAKMIGNAMPGYKVITNKEVNAHTFLIVPADSDEWDWQQSESIQVNELLDKPLPYKQRDDDDDWKSYMFKTSDGRRFTVVMDNLPMDVWDIAFTDDEMSSDKTGKGGAVEIFATVGAIIKEFIQKVNPRAIKFSAIDNEPSRVKLYKRLAAMGAKQFPQYNLSVRQAAGGADFILKKEEETQEENINELFDQPLSYEVDRDIPEKKTFSFVTSDGRKFNVFMDHMSTNDIWDVHFSDNRARSNKTGEGSATEIFSTVAKIIFDFIEKEDPNGIYFSVVDSEESRKKLYKRLAVMGTKKFPQYKLEIDDSSDATGYQLKKPKQQENINELFNQPLKYNKIVGRASDEGKKLTWRFDTPSGNQLQVEAYFDKNQDKWEFGFYDFENDSAEINGKGDAAQVFATVMEIGEEFIADKKPRMVEFFADNDEPSRVKLYNRMVKTLAQRMPDYDIKSQDYGGSFQRYVMIRKDSVNESVFTDLEEFVTQNQLNDVERFAEKLFKKYNIDVDFTRHFFDRINDERNVKIGGSEITVPELQKLFKKEQRQWGKKIAQLPDGEEGVMKDKETSINVPFVKKDTPNSEPDKLITKTAMKKPNFKSNTPFYPVESKKRLTLRSLFEASGKTAAFAFGRLNPATNGHELLVNEIVAQDADAFLYLSDRPAALPKDPLEPKDKQAWAQASFPQIKVKLANNALLAADELFKMGYTNLIYLEGEPKMGKVIQKYNGQETAKHNFNFDNVNLVQLTRDPDSEGAAGMSATKLRQTVIDDDFEAFTQGITKPAQRVAKEMFSKLQAALTQTESAAGPSDGSYEKSKQEPPVKWTRGLFDHIFSTMKPGSPWIDDSSTTAFIPMVASTINILSGEDKRQMYGAHVLGIKDIPKLIALQGKKGKQISAFTTDEYGALETGLWTEGGIIAIIKGVAMSGGPGDIMSKVDKQGRRVVDFGPKSPAMNNIGKIADSKAFKTAIQELINVRRELVKELKANFPRVTDVDGQTKHAAIKKYMDAVNATLKNNKQVMRKAMIAWAENQSKKWSGKTEYGEYDEIVMGNFKIIKLFVKPSSEDHNAQTYQFRDYFEKNEFPFPVEYVRDTSVQHLKRFLDQNNEASENMKALDIKQSIKEDDDFDDDGNRRPIGPDEAPKWTRSLFDHLFMKKGTKYDGPDRPFTKGDKEVFIPLVPAMIDKLVGGPTELYGAHSTGMQNLDRLIKMQGKKGKQISVFTTDREGQLSDGVWGGGGVVAILRGNAYAASSGDIMSVVDKQGRRVLDIGPSGDLMNLEDNEDFLYGDEYPAMYKAIRSLQRSITAKIEDIFDERGDVEGKEKAAFIKEYIDGLYQVIPKYKQTFSKLMVGWAQSQSKNWQEVHGSYDEVVMGNYRIVHIFLIGKDRQQVSKLESFMQEKAMGYVRKAGEGMVEDPNAKDPFIEKLYKEGKLKLIDKTEEDFPYQVLDRYMKQNKEMKESMAYARDYALGKLIENISSIQNTRMSKDQMPGDPDWFKGWEDQNVPMSKPQQRDKPKRKRTKKTTEELMSTAPSERDDQNQQARQQVDKERSTIKKTAQANFSKIMTQHKDQEEYRREKEKDSHHVANRAKLKTGKRVLDPNK